MVFQNKGSDGKTVANFNSGGSNGPYRTDVFNDSYALVEFSKDAKENYAGSSTIENFWGKPIEEAKVAKLEPLPIPKQKSKVNEFQKNENTAKETLWEKMVRKVETKKSNSKTLEKNPHNKVVVAKKMNSIKSKTRRSRSSNLAPISGLRPFEGGGSSIQSRSFR